MSSQNSALNQMYLAGKKAAFEFFAYSSVFINRDLEDAEKIILPQPLLEGLLRTFANRLPTPIVFEISNVRQRKASHCGVLEFSSPDGNAYLPHWMMENLMLKDGDTIRLKVKDPLPAATKIVFQPVRYAFHRIENPKAALENALGRFTCATEGDVLFIRFSKTDRESWHHLIVKTVEPKLTTTPPFGVSLVNTAVAVEFEESAEPEPEEEKVQEIPLEQPMTDRYLSANDSHYYRVRRTNVGLSLLITLTSKKGDPDVYATVKVEKPGRTENMWKNNGAGGVGIPKTLIVDAKDSQLKKENTMIWFSVNAYKAESVYDVLVREVDPAAANDSKASALASRTGGAVAAATKKMTAAEEEAKKAAGYVKCGNCRQFISKAAMIMHSAQCERLNWFCELCDGVVKRTEKDTHTHCHICNIVLNKEALAKHVDFEHGALPCPLCFKSISGGAAAIEKHKKEECTMRLVDCPHCQAKFPQVEHGAHVSYCLSRSIQCDLCGKAVPRKKMEIHKAVEHGINSSLDGEPGMQEVAYTGPLGALKTDSSSSSSFGPLSPVPITRQTTDEELLKAVMHSTKMALEEEDKELQRVLLASQMDTSSSAAQSSSTSTSSPAALASTATNGARSAATPPPAAASASASAKSSAASTSKNTDPVQCTHCGYDAVNMRELEQHFKECLALNSNPAPNKRNSLSGYDSFNEDADDVNDTNEDDGWGDGEFE